jgi:hypothetical protein
MANRLELTGRRFGHWTALGRSARRCGWLCRCDCGTERSVISSDLLSGRSSACGCTRRTRRSHGHTARASGRTPEYAAWAAMKTRCTNPNGDFWYCYGGRGIRVAAEWVDSFEAFFAHVGPRPSGRHSLDRIDANGHYEPGNVRWATPEEQANNKTSCRFLEHGGERMTLRQWARKLGITSASLRDRLRRNPTHVALGFSRGGTRSGHQL